MAESATLTIRLPKEDLERLEILARDTRRSRSFLAAEAIANYVKYHEWKIQAVREGIASAERGEWISDEAVDGWLASWGTDHELPPPEIGD
jgi:RHH-type transcriptional regulator, rel operon repressor / antitoxin RelB